MPKMSIFPSKNNISQVFDMLEMWKVSRIDSVLWVVTLVAVIIIDVDIGLLVGVFLAVGVLIMRGQNPVMARLGNIHGSEMYLDKNKYKQVSCTQLRRSVVLSHAGRLYSVTQVSNSCTQSRRTVVLSHVGQLYSVT